MAELGESDKLFLTCSIGVTFIPVAECFSPSIGRGQKRGELFSAGLDCPVTFCSILMTWGLLAGEHGHNGLVLALETQPSVGKMEGFRTFKNHSSSSSTHHLGKTSDLSLE